VNDEFIRLFKKCEEVTDQLLKAAADDKDKIKKAVAQKIKIYRMGNRLTQTELAEKLGVTKMEIIRWEAGRNKPNSQAMERLKEVGIL